MAQDSKTTLPSSAALQAMTHSLRQAAATASKSPLPQVHLHKSQTTHAPPAPRDLSHGMTALASPALARAQISAAWQPLPLAAPATFRDSPAGHAWQMTHFRAVWQHLGPAATPASISKARTFVAQRSKGVSAEELEAYIYDMRIGAECHQGYLVRLVALSLPQGPMARAYAGLAQALCSELERRLSGVHEAVRDLFVQDLRERTYLNVLELPTRS